MINVNKDAVNSANNKQRHAFLITIHQNFSILDKLIEFFGENAKSDYQTNHYFDTKRFSLKALNTSLRVRQREDFELTFKRKKGYNIELKSVKITKDDFKELRNSGVVVQEELVTDVTNLIKEQKLVNFLSLSTLRHYVPYGSGMLNIDKSEYVGIIDYEIDKSWLFD